MTVYERSEKKSHLDTVWYEIAMLGFCHSELGTRSGMSEPERNLLIEGFLLHYRNILEFCSGAKHRPAKNGKPADISTADPQVWASRALTQEELAKIQASAQVLEAKYFEDISQFLQHCTERRFIDSKQWNLDEMLAELSPIVSALCDAFPPKSEQQKAESVLSRNAAGTTTFTQGPPLGSWTFKKPE
jgi:hypothetical protein